jgi:Ca2+-binding EF-hand superfamily protein
MSVSSINPATAETHKNARGGSSGASSAAGMSAAATTSGSAAASTSADASTSSTTVTLSAGAQLLSSLASAGVSVTLTSLSSLGISPSDVANATTLPQQYALMQQIHQSLVSHGDLLQPDGTVSQSAFEKMITESGGTKAQADQLFQSLDTSGDGSISTQEFLTGIGGTSEDGNSPIDQSLLKLMDTDGDGSVSFSEFSDIEERFAQAENGKA